MAMIWLQSAIKGVRHRWVATILAVSILGGAGLTIGARLQLDNLLTVSSGANIEISIDDVEGDCGTPSLYVLPSTNGQTSTLRVLVDFLGGVNRFPTLGGVEATTPVLVLPEDRASGVGLGRGLPERCQSMQLQISGDFVFSGVAAQFPGVGMVDMQAMSNIGVSQNEEGQVTLDYRRTAGDVAGDALVAFELAELADLWQYAYKRVGFVNRGMRDVNVFFYEEPGYLFVNSFDNNVRPVSANRSFVDAHLATSAQAGDNSVVIYRRKPTAEIELQRALISISTLFGIGVSLLIEGLVFGLVTLAGRSGTPTKIDTAK